MRTIDISLLIALFSLVLAAPHAWGAAAEGSAWIAKIRRDHPRLYINRDLWPAVRERALSTQKEHFARVKQHADGPPPREEWSIIQRPAPRPGSNAEVRDWGNQLMSSAFVYLVERDPGRLARIREMLQASADYYDACFAANKAVSWYGTSRIGWLAAIDWVWSELPPGERQSLGQQMLRHVDAALHRQNIQRRNDGDYRTGYYGDNCLAWYAGVVFLNEGIDDAKAFELLQQGYDDYQKLRAHRARMSGRQGGAASPTLSYSFGEYPNAEWNFLYTWRAAAGEDAARDWSYIAGFPNYVLWNRLPGGLEYGYGDTPHVDNLLPQWSLYLHLSQIMHFFGQSNPDAAALAAALREKFPLGFSAGPFSIYPFLMTELENAPSARRVPALPPAQHFASMGQTFMRSGGGDDDTYALFACGGVTGQHRHYDATHFTIFHRGFLALDTGTRAGNTDNLQNYFAQTIAHNCVLIKMPGEPPSPYWNGTVFGQAGGQNQQVGSQVAAFETGPYFTYVAGDATPTYDARKCRQMVRQFLFLPPSHFVVFDRVVATRADYAKTWLLHHANEPTIEGKMWRSDQGRGRIFCRTLLPEDAVLEKVGGPGKEFLVEGTNFAIDAGPAEYIRKNEYQIDRIGYKETPELMGRWRMEVRPGALRAEDVFLHLIQVGGQEMEKMGEAAVRRREGMVTLTFSAGDRRIVLTFPTEGPVGGHIRIARGGHVLVDRGLASEVVQRHGSAM